MCAITTRTSPWDKLCPAEMPESGILESTPINALPDSLLLHIFELDYYQVRKQARGIPPPALRAFDHETTTTKSILRVCRRWNAIATPLLYRRVRIELHKTRFTRSVTRLLSTLQAEPRLRSWTREVDILLDGIFTPDFTQSDAMEVVQLLRFWQAGLRSACVHGCIDAAESRLILLQLGKLSLEDFTCSGYESGIPLSLLLTHFELSRAKKLSLDRVRLWDHTESLGGSSWPPIVNQEVALPVERHHPSGLKELDLSDPYVPAHTLDVLLRQPKSLERLTMTFLMHSRHANTYTAHAIERLLQFQQHSLRCLEFGIMCQGNDGLDLTNMTALEILRLNSYTVFETSALKAASKLAAPKLKHFIIEFSTEDQHDVDPMSDMQQATSWLQQFVATRKSCLPDEADTLKQIELNFNPELRYGVTWENVRQPWQCLEQTRTNLEGFGVKLSYPKPISDDGDWHKYLGGSWEPPDIMDETDTSGTEEDVADMCCSDDVDHSQCDASFTEHNHDPAQTRLCQRLEFRVSCVH